MKTWNAVFKERKWGEYGFHVLYEYLVTSGWASRAEKEHIRVLELGCATGATTKQLADVGFCVFAVDGAPEAIRQAKLKLDGLSNVYLYCCDFKDLHRRFKPEFFDLVIDVCALQHNRFGQTCTIVDRVQGLMKPGAIFWSMMIADGTTRDIYADLPYTHFATKRDVIAIFGNLKPVYTDEYIRSLRGAQSIHWLICCENTKRMSDGKNDDRDEA